MKSGDKEHVGNPGLRATTLDSAAKRPVPLPHLPTPQDFSSTVLCRLFSLQHD